MLLMAGSGFAEYLRRCSLLFQKFCSRQFYVIVKAQKSHQNKIKGFGIITACL